MWALSALVLCGLATWQVVEIMRHSNLALFRFTRWLALAAENSGPVTRFLLAPVRAVLCGWCLSVWAGCVMAVMCLLGVGEGPPLGYLWLALPMALAGSRLANLGNDLTHAWCRTPRQEDRLERYTDEQLEAELYRRLGPALYGARESGPEVRDAPGAGDGKIN